VNGHPRRDVLRHGQVAAPAGPAPVLQPRKPAHLGPRRVPWENYRARECARPARTAGDAGLIHVAGLPEKSDGSPIG